MKKKIFIFFSSLFLVMAVIEMSMIFRFGKPTLEADSPQFQYQYIDIYKKFFKKVRKNNKYVYIPQRAYNNAKEFPVVKPQNTLRIFIIGGSVAYNFGLFDFKNTLETLILNKNFEVICCGMGAYDSYRDSLVEKEILSYKPDLIIVFPERTVAMS